MFKINSSVVWNLYILFEIFKKKTDVGYIEFKTPSINYNNITLLIAIKIQYKNKKKSQRNLLEFQITYYPLITSKLILKLFFFLKCF